MGIVSSIVSKSAVGALAVGALVALAPASAKAVTLNIEDKDSGVTATVSDGATAIFSGSVGAFDISVASAGISSQADEHRLQTTSIETDGVGWLQITATETDLTDFGASSLNLFGTGSTSDIGHRVRVRHFVDTGGGFVQIGDHINLWKSDGDVQGGSVGQSFATGPDGILALRTIFDIINTEGNTSSNINATLVAAVPLPAAGLLLLGGLGGLVAMRRKRKAA